MNPINHFRGKRLRKWFETGWIPWLILHRHLCTVSSKMWSTQILGMFDNPRNMEPRLNYWRKFTWNELHSDLFLVELRSSFNLNSFKSINYQKYWKFGSSESLTIPETWSQDWTIQENSLGMSFIPTCFYWNCNRVSALIRPNRLIIKDVGCSDPLNIPSTNSDSVDLLINFQLRIQSNINTKLKTQIQRTFRYLRPFPNVSSTKRNVT